MKQIKSPRLILSPLSDTDFDQFVSKMLTDPRVVEFYHSYRKMDDLEMIRANAKIDFWDHFEESRTDYGLEVWAAHVSGYSNQFIGWCGLLHTELTDKYQGFELQYMIAGGAHGNGYATEIATAVMQYAESQMGLKSLIATVDIPNIGSVKVLEKLAFNRVGQIEAYGSADMYLYRKDLG